MRSVLCVPELNDKQGKLELSPLIGVSAIEELSVSTGEAKANCSGIVRGKIFFKIGAFTAKDWVEYSTFLLIATCLLLMVNGLLSFECYPLLKKRLLVNQIIKETEER